MANPNKAAVASGTRVYTSRTADGTRVDAYRTGKRGRRNAGCVETVTPTTDGRFIHRRVAEVVRNSWGDAWVVEPTDGSESYEVSGSMQDVVEEVADRTA